MNFQDVLEIVESAVYKAKGRRLTDPELTVLRGSWEGLTYEKMAKGSPYKPNYLKGDVSHKFWKLLSEALGEEVSKRNFRAALQRTLLSHNASLQVQNIDLGVDDANLVSQPSSQSELSEIGWSSQSSYLNFQSQGGLSFFPQEHETSQSCKEPCELEKKMRAWFEALGYELIPGGRRQEDYFEMIVHIPKRGGYDRILARGVEGEANLNHLDGLCQAVKEYKPNEGWLVADLRISRAVREAIAEYRATKELKFSHAASEAIAEYRKQRELELFCYTFDEVIDEGVNFTQYFKWLEEQLRKRGINDKTYVPLACVKQEGINPVTGEPIVSRYAEADGWIDGYIDRWLDDPDKKHISVLGEFGTGKTWFAFHYAWTALKRYQEAKKQGTPRPRLPLLIPLRDYTKALNVENVLAWFFFSIHNIPLTNLVFKQLNSMGKLLLIFDGFDEMAGKVDRRKVIDNFWELAKVVETGAKVILTCRAEHLPKIEKGRSLLNAALLDSIETEQPTSTRKLGPQFEVLELQILSNGQIRQMLRSRLQDKTQGERDAIVEQVTRNHKLLDLARRPVMIDLILDALPKIEADQPVDLSHIYLLAVREKMARDIKAERTFTSPADKLYFLCELSWEMFVTDQMQLNYRNFPDRIRRLFGSIVQEPEEIDHWSYDMMGQSMLTRNADGDYELAHRSFLEFFIAYKLAAQLGVLASDFVDLATESLHIDKNAPPQAYTWFSYFQRQVDEQGKVIPIAPLKEFSTVSLNRLFNAFRLGELTNRQRDLTKAVLDLLEHMLDRSKTAAERLMAVIKATRGKAEKEVGYLAGYAVTLLLQIDPEALAGQDLSHTVIQGADLTNANLQNTNLTGAYLDDSLFKEPFGSILSVAFSGEFFAIGSSNGEICLFQGQRRSICKGHNHWVRSIAFSPDGQRFASGSDDQAVKIWDIKTGKFFHTLEGHTSCVRSVTFSHDGKLLASGSEDGTIKIWNVNTGEYLKTLTGHVGKIWSVAFSPVGRLLASAGEDKTIKLWDVNTGNCLKTLTGHENWVRAVAFSPDGRQIVSGGDDNTVRIWDIRTTKCRTNFLGHENWVRSVAFSPDGQKIVSGSDDNTVRIWDVQTGLCRNILYGHDNRVWSVAFSLNGEQIASGSDDQTVKTWDAQTGQCLSTVRGYSNWILSVAFSPNSKYLANGSEDKIVRIWNIHTGKIATTLRGHTSRIWSVAFSPDGRLLASGSDDHTIRIWELKHSKSKQCLRVLKDHDHWVRSVAFSPDGQLLASGSDDNTVRIWDIHRGTPPKILRGHGNWVRTVIFSPNGQLLASGSDDRTIRIWDVQTGDTIKILHGHENLVRSIAFSSDGQIVASGSNDCTVKIWEMSKGECIKTITEHNNWVHSVIFSLDGHTLISGSQDGSVHLWNIHEDKLIKSFQEDADEVLSVAFSPDRQLIAAGIHDGMIRLRNMHNDELKPPLSLKIPKPYEGMNITGVIGLTEDQRANLRALGAVELG
ncbi:pentapeptide repeat-containing protein [Fischerella sp. PCC 9605]|uniref:WD40 domain-containing protein n=1 Tax=Fischerella sp. PCC 9605 TaxID=1173024 RepID=UPI00047CBD80|nr:pentapeptide repeat-containing protein [Fischerella sp. PCC 9605]